jgi:hypothetical protein
MHMSLSRLATISGFASLMPAADPGIASDKIVFGQAAARDVPASSLATSLHGRTR